MRLYLFLFFNLLFSAFVFCQDIIPRFNNLSVNDGLPSNSVYSITQDKKGFIWFGTQDGICSFDGNEFLKYKYHPKSSNEIFNNFVRGKLLEDKLGNIWYSNESGIYKWDRASKKVIRLNIFKEISVETGKYKLVGIDSTDRIWLYNVIKGIISFHTVSNEVRYFPFPFKFDYSKEFHNYGSFANQVGKHNFTYPKEEKIFSLKQNYLQKPY